MPFWLFAAGLNGLVAVAAGAYGWHGLASEPALQKMFEIASSNQALHALAVLAAALTATHVEGVARTLAHVASACFLVGIVLFSGTLYWLVLADSLLMQGAAPLGGMLLMAGWLLLMATAVAEAVRRRQYRASKRVT